MPTDALMDFQNTLASCDKLLTRDPSLSAPVTALLTGQLCNWGQVLDDANIDHAMQTVDAELATRDASLNDLAFFQKQIAIAAAKEPLAVQSFEKYWREKSESKWTAFIEQVTKHLISKGAAPDIAAQQAAQLLNKQNLIDGIHLSVQQTYEIVQWLAMIALRERQGALLAKVFLSFRNNIKSLQTELSAARQAVRDAGNDEVKMAAAQARLDKVMAIYQTPAEPEGAVLLSPEMTAINTEVDNEAKKVAAADAQLEKIVAGFDIQIKKLTEMQAELSAARQAMMNAGNDEKKRAAAQIQLEKATAAIEAQQGIIKQEQDRLQKAQEEVMKALDDQNKVLEKKAQLEREAAVKGADKTTPEPGANQQNGPIVLLPAVAEFVDSSQRMLDDALETLRGHLAKGDHAAGISAARTLASSAEKLLLATGVQYAAAVERTARGSWLASAADAVAVGGVIQDLFCASALGRCIGWDLGWPSDFKSPSVWRDEASKRSTNKAKTSSPLPTVTGTLFSARFIAVPGTSGKIHSSLIISTADGIGVVIAPGMDAVAAGLTPGCVIEADGKWQTIPSINARTLVVSQGDREHASWRDWALGAVSPISAPRPALLHLRWSWEPDTDAPLRQRTWYVMEAG
jgi:hypothetical protein